MRFGAVVALMAVAVAADLGPEIVADHFKHSERAWEFVLRGVEAAALWSAIAAWAYADGRWFIRWPGICVAAFGVFTAIQRPLCRFAFPMDKAPGLPNGQYLCNAAGYSTAELSIIAAGIVALVVSVAADKKD